jgi:hypothetical protein
MSHPLQAVAHATAVSSLCQLQPIIADISSSVQLFSQNLYSVCCILASTTIPFIGELESLAEGSKAQTDSDTMSDAKKKIVRFGRGEGQSMEDESGWSEPQVKDSGIDTGLSSSSQTINEEQMKVIVRGCEKC